MTLAAFFPRMITKRVEKKRLSIRRVQLRRLDEPMLAGMRGGHQPAPAPPLPPLLPEPNKDAVLEVATSARVLRNCANHNQVLKQGGRR